MTRVTQTMLTQRSLQGMQTSASRVALIQEQLTTGRVLNRPSDSPTETTASMRLRSSLADSTQFVRNAEDGGGWLAQADTSLQSMLDETRRARDLVLQGRNGASGSAASRGALAGEIEQQRDSLISLANTSYLGRPVFGGVTAGGIAYAADGTYVGTTAGEVTRTVGPGVAVRVDVDAREAFGPDGDSVFDAFDLAADALRAGDPDAAGVAMLKLDAAMERLTSALAEVGGRTNRIESAHSRAADAVLNTRARISSVEDVDVAEAAMNLSMQEVAHQAALAASARVVQPSLLDYLR